MRLCLKNIGKIKDACVEINGITVIAGENDTGKSTVGRALFAVFNSFYNVDKRVKRERKQSIERQVEKLYRSQPTLLTRTDIDEIAQNIVSETEKYKKNPALVLEEFKAAGVCQDVVQEKSVDTIDIREVVTRIGDILNISDEEILKLILEKRLLQEFNEQISNIFSDNDSEIELQIKD